MKNTIISHLPRQRHLQIAWLVPVNGVGLSVFGIEQNPIRPNRMDTGRRRKNIVTLNEYVMNKNRAGAVCFL